MIVMMIIFFHQILILLRHLGHHHPRSRMLLILLITKITYIYVFLQRINVLFSFAVVRGLQNLLS